MRVGQSKYARAQFGLPQMNFLMLTCAILLFQIFEIFFQALGKVSLTPVIGAGLLGTAAHDALGTGAVGTMVKAKELIYKVQEGDAEDVGGEDEVEVGSISETVNKSAERAAATPIEIFDPDTCDYKYLRENYVAKGIPFILRKPNGEAISNASPPKLVDDGD